MTQEQRDSLTFKSGDKVEVEYSYGKTYSGTVVYSEIDLYNEWVYIRPDNGQMAVTFGSSRDMANGYKGYLYKLGGAAHTKIVKLQEEIAS